MSTVNKFYLLTYLLRQGEPKLDRCVKRVKCHSNLNFHGFGSKYPIFVPHKAPCAIIFTYINSAHITLLNCHSLIHIFLYNL